MESQLAPEIEIWAVRHGQTFDNIQHLCQGHTDGKLTPDGEQQASVLGDRLAKVQFDGAYVSDLGRTRETYQKIASRRDNPIKEVKFEPLLREKSGGIFEGKSLKLVADAAKVKNAPVRDFRPQNGECWKDVYARSALLVKLLFYEQMLPTVSAAGPTRKILLVSHGGWIMELLNYIRFKEEGITPVWSNSARNCCVNIIKMKCVAKPDVLEKVKSVEGVQDSFFKLQIIMENDISHFEGTTLADTPKAPPKTSINASTTTKSTALPTKKQPTLASAKPAAEKKISTTVTKKSTSQAAVAPKKP